MIIDWTTFTFTAEQIRSIKELTFDEVVNAPDMQAMHTMMGGIIYDKEVGFIIPDGLVGIKHQGCDPTPQSLTIAGRKITWQPKEWEVFVASCASEFENTMVTYARKTGTAIDDLTGTDYETIMVAILAKLVKSMIMRLVWFGDVDAATAGQLFVTANSVHFDLIDGLFKQMETQITANPSQKVTIAENTAATYALQELDPANVGGYISDLVMKADVTLRGEGGRIYCTQTFADAYFLYLTSKGVTPAYVDSIEGIEVLKYNNVEIMPVPFWDEQIKAYYNDGVRLINPHRAVFTNKDYLLVGYGGSDVESSLDVWYDRDSRKTKFESKGKLDAKLSNPEKFQLAI